MKYRRQARGGCVERMRHERTRLTKRSLAVCDEGYSSSDTSRPTPSNIFMKQN